MSNFTISFFLRYDIALSFAEENRGFVDRIADALKSKGIKVFYDDYERTKIWGKHLGPYLDEVYRRRARYCLIFISEHYILKRWTLHEIERAKARAYSNEKREYILPFRLDDTVMREIPDTIVYLSVKTHDEQQLVAAIIEKLNEQPRKRIIAGTKNFLSNRLRLMVLVIATLGLSALPFVNRFTPINPLTKSIHEQSATSYHGARCKDGSFSTSHGRGTCSGHGGVDHYLDTVIYSKTIEESRKEAIRTSWFPSEADTAEH